MPRVVLAPHVRRHVDCPPHEVPAGPLCEVLESVFAEFPRLRGYLLDDQGALRKHVTVYIDSQPIRDAAGLSDYVAPGAEVYLLQALSGG